MAKLVELAKWYKEPVDIKELILEEHNLFSTVYRNVIGTRHALWRIISPIEQEESHSDEGRVTAIRENRNKIQLELDKVWDGIPKLLESKVIPSFTVAESI